MYSTEKIRTAKGLVLSATVFEGKEAMAVLVIASATGVKQGFYRRFSEYLSQQGITVITFDYHGIGESLTEPIDKVQTDAYDWGADNLEAVIGFAVESFPASKIWLLGHSIGGQLIGLAKSSLLAEKIILVAAQSGYWKFWEGPAKFSMWATWHLVFPMLTFLFGYLPAKRISRMENLPGPVARAWRAWCVSPNYLFDHIRGSAHYYDEIRAKIISFSVEDDVYAPTRSVDWLSGKYTRAGLVRKHIFLAETGMKHIGHFGFFNAKVKDTVWPMALDALMQ